MALYHVAFWNVENLFAPEGFAERPAWLAQRLRSDLGGWTPALFDRKIAQLARIIGGMNGGAGPDLLGVCEVENRFALDSLCARLNAALPARRYATVHADATLDQRGIDTAFVHDTARLGFVEGTLFNHFVLRRTGTRDITQATFATPEGAELVAMCNHWPSRSGGTYESSGFRITAGETLGWWHERVREVKGPNVALIAMGDFNDEPWDASMQVHANATREREDVENARSARFLNLGWSLPRQPATAANGAARMLYGSLYFGGDGFQFDQILVSPAMLNGRGAFGVREETARIVAPPEMVSSSKNAGAIRFGLPSGDAARNVDPDGYSDHFPVEVMVETRG